MVLQVDSSALARTRAITTLDVTLIAVRVLDSVVPLVLQVDPIVPL